MTLSRSTHPAADMLIKVSLAFVPALDAWREAICRRETRRSIGCLSDAKLRDIGLTAHDLDVALSMPLGRNASDVLARASEETAKW